MDYLIWKNGREINQEFKINDSVRAAPFLSFNVLRDSVCSFPTCKSKNKGTSGTSRTIGSFTRVFSVLSRLVQ